MIRKPRVCFLGPMVGRRHGFAICQALIVANLLAEDGYRVVTASSRINRYARLLDLIGTLVRHRHAIDIVCLEVYGGPSFVVEDLASRTANVLGKPLVMTLHGGALPAFMAQFPRWTQAVLRRATRLVAPSEFLRRAVAEHGFDARVIPNVIDLQHYPYRHRARVAPRLFWMRAFHPIYNPELAIRVLSRVKHHIPDASLVMAGQSKGAEADVEQLARDMGLADAVQFPGFLDHDGKRREGNAADIFINTNRIDNMPVAVLEAGAMGLPVVATAVGGVPDLLVDGRDGVLVPDDDDAAMADAILRLLQDPELAGRLSRNGRLLAERSAWQSVRVQWQCLFREMLA
jgi:glycosyltransferase involved in cell wall biosynthesis